MNGLVDRKANYMNRKSLNIEEVEYDAGGNIKSLLVEFVRNDRVDFSVVECTHFFQGAHVDISNCYLNSNFNSTLIPSQATVAEGPRKKPQSITGTSEKSSL